MTADLEHQKWLFEQNAKAAERAHEELAAFRRHVNEAAIASGTLAIRSALLVNGGAVVVILGFLGGVSGNGKVDLARITAVTSTLTWFGLGVISAMSALVFAYVTNFVHSAIASAYDTNNTQPFIHENERTHKLRRMGIIANGAAFVFGIMSLMLFIIGIFFVQNAVAQLLAARG
jgi:hypothetical protein